MADLNYIQQAQEVKITGQDTVGTTVNYVGADANGNLLVKDYATSATGSAIPSNASLMGGSVTTSAPTYTTGQLNALSLTVAGALRVDGSGVVQPVSQSGTWNINNISGTISLPTGAATSANQSTEITSLQLIDNMIGPVTPGTVASGSALIGGQFNTTLPTLSTGQQAAFQLDSSGRQIIAPLTNTSVVKAQLQDNSGNAILAINNQVEARDVINVSSQYQAISVTTSSVEAKGAGTRLVNRKVLTITPTNGIVYWGTSTGVTTATGTPIFTNQMVVLAFTDNVPVYLISAGTVNVRIVEGS